MDELMQTLYEYITDGKIQKYRGMTDYYTCQMIEKHVSQEFVEQLTMEIFLHCDSFGTHSIKFPG